MTYQEAFLSLTNKIRRALIDYELANDKAVELHKQVENAECFYHEINDALAEADNLKFDVKADMTGADLIHNLYDDVYEALGILDDLDESVVGEELCGQISSDIYWYEKFGSILEERTAGVEII